MSAEFLEVPYIRREGLSIKYYNQEGNRSGTYTEIKAALWNFINKIGVEPTNNIAEQVLRKIVIWRKVCFGTWSANGTLYLERVMTVVATCRLQHRSVYGFLREAIQAHLERKNHLLYCQN